MIPTNVTFSSTKSECSNLICSFCVRQIVGQEAKKKLAIQTRPGMNQTAQATVVPSSPGSRRVRPWLVVYTLSWREFVRFFRQFNRVIGAIGTPLLFWLLFGTGLHQSFQVAAEGPSFREYFFPGTLVLILMFTAIFFLDLDYPGPSRGVSAIGPGCTGFPLGDGTGKISGGTLIAWIQVLLCLVLVLTLDVQIGWLNVLGMMGVLLLGALTLTSMGFVMAWNMESIQGFHAIMNLVLMPMWLLSGAFFPVPAVSVDSALSQQVLHWVMRCNPLTYVVAPLQELLFGRTTAEAIWMPSLSTALLLILLFLSLAFTLACRISRRRTTGDLL